MNWLDILIIISLILAGFGGWRTGLVRGVVMLAGIVLGVVLAGQLGGRIGENLGMLGDPGSSRLLGFAVIFGLCVLGAFVLGIVVRKLLTVVWLGWLDSLGGLVAGLVTSALIWTALVIAAGSTSLPWATEAVHSSRLARQLADDGSVVMAMLPGKYRSVLSWVGEVQDPTVRVTGVMLRESSADAAQLEGLLSVENPNRFGGTVQQVAYEVYWNDGAEWRLAGGGKRSIIPIGAGEDRSVSLPLEVERKVGFGSGVLLDALRTRPSLQVRLQGTATVNFPSETVELTFSDERPLRRG